MNGNGVLQRADIQPLPQTLNPYAQVLHGKRLQAVRYPGHAVRFRPCNALQYSALQPLHMKWRRALGAHSHAVAALVLSSERAASSSLSRRSV